jgi:hypothetical protein
MVGMMPSGCRFDKWCQNAYDGFPFDENDFRPDPGVKLSFQFPANIAHASGPKRIPALILFQNRIY